MKDDKEKTTPRDLDAEFADFTESRMFEEIEGHVISIARIAFAAGMSAGISESCRQDKQNV